VKIAQQTPELLVLTDFGAAPRNVGGICILMGGAFAYAGMRQPGIVILPYLIAVGMAIGGLALIILPGRVTAAFDRARHTLVITRQSLRGGKVVEEVDFSKITGVEAEASEKKESGDMPTMWRVTIVLRDGTRLPLTTYYSNSATHAVAAAAACKFLALPAPAIAAPAPAAAARLAPMFGSVRPGNKGATVFTTVFAGILLSVFFGLGSRLAYTQYQRLATYRPTPAVVLSVNVGTHASSGRNSGVSYSPDIAYRYSVDGHTYVSTRATPINESRGGHWAFDIAARYRPGDSVTAYYDPTRPGDAFLLHQTSFLPYIFVAFPLAIALLLTFSVIRSRRKLQAALATTTTTSSTPLRG
jgi:hypothetical protein